MCSPRKSVPHSSRRQTESTTYLAAKRRGSSGPDPPVQPDPQAPWTRLDQLLQPDRSGQLGRLVQPSPSPQRPPPALVDPWRRPLLSQPTGSKALR